MVKLWKGGAYLINGTELIEDGGDCAEKLKRRLKIPWHMGFWRLIIRPGIWIN